MILYKKLISTSNALYNRGLEKAKVRDLSGAVEDLKNSLKVWKENIPARNLLGLVYFEMGEVVSALSEWIVSKNYQPENNIADTYIEEVQKNTGRLENYNMALKKYNQALLYAEKGSLDLAIIQLKKVLSVHEKFVSAHLLLALVAIQSNQIELARKELKKVLHIDRGNVLALSYFNETDALRGQSADRKASKISKDAVAYTSGNETIIQPKSFQENGGRNIALDIMLGFVLGAAICWFVFVPARIQGAKSDVNKQVIEYSDQIEANQTQIDSLTKEAGQMKAQVKQAEDTAAAAQKKSDSYEALFEAQKLAKASDFEGAAETLAKVDAESLTEGAKAIYDEVYGSVNATAVNDLYTDGKNKYNSRKYAEAVESLEKLVSLSPEHADGIYYLARSYDGLGDVENAKKYYRKVVELLPAETIRAQNAQSFLANHP